MGAVIIINIVSQRHTLTGPDNIELLFVATKTFSSSVVVYAEVEMYLKNRTPSEYGVTFFLLISAN